MDNMRIYINAFLKFRHLLAELVKRDLVVRYRRSLLGMVWTVLNPLLMMIIMTLVFSNIFSITIQNFPVYVMIGNIVFTCNSESTTNGMSTLIWNASLLKKVYIPKYLFPLSSVISSYINFLFSFCALLIVMVITGAPFHATIFWCILPAFLMFAFSFGLSLILASINVFFRDMQHLYSVITLLWMYVSAVFYSTDILSPQMVQLINWNPMYQYISFFRQIVMQGVFPGWNTILMCCVSAFGALFIGLFTFKRSQSKFILHI